MIISHMRKNWSRYRIVIQAANFVEWTELRLPNLLLDEPFIHSVKKLKSGWTYFINTVLS